jgi:hypothetical protein
MYNIYCFQIQPTCFGHTLTIFSPYILVTKYILKCVVQLHILRCTLDTKM